jgi:hypothetical protein
MGIPQIRYISTLLLLLLLASHGVAQAIYKTPSGKKYHLAECRMVTNVSEKITPQKALQLGLQPCKICHPVMQQLHFTSQNKAVGESTKTVQCSGITKKGTRCKHHTNIANGYCFQHQPKDN